MNAVSRDEYLPCSMAITVPCHADFIREFLLRHIADGAELSNLIVYDGHQSAVR